MRIDLKVIDMRLDLLVCDLSTSLPFSILIIVKLYWTIIYVKHLVLCEKIYFEAYRVYICEKKIWHHNKN